MLFRSDEKAGKQNESVEEGDGFERGFGRDEIVEREAREDGFRRRRRERGKDGGARAGEERDGGGDACEENVRDGGKRE